MREPGGAVQVDRHGLEVLDRAECLRLLGTVSLCRVGVTQGALPAVLPVHFALADERLVIRSAGGTGLHVALRGTVVAVEADDLALDGSHGWSVLVRGRSDELTRPADLAVARGLGLPSWAGDLDRFVAVHVETATGRRFPTPARQGAR